MHPILECLQECREFFLKLKDEEAKKEALKKLEETREKVVTLLKEKLI